MKKITVSILVLCLLLALSAAAFADDGFVFKQGFDLDYPGRSRLTVLSAGLTLSFVRLCVNISAGDMRLFLSTGMSKMPS